MPSERVQTFVPDREAARIRELANQSGLSVSSMTSLLLCSALKNSKVVSALVADGDRLGKP